MDYTNVKTEKLVTNLNSILKQHVSAQDIKPMINGIGKQSRYGPRQVVKVPGVRGSQKFHSAQEGVKAVSPTLRLPLLPGIIPESTSGP
jgi:hypothetical protein